MTTGLFASVSITTYANSIANGTCGTNAEFNLYNDNILVISGEGAMADYVLNANNSTAPWSISLR